jgi:hypothetical protein
MISRYERKSGVVMLRRVGLLYQRRAIVVSAKKVLRTRHVAVKGKAGETSFI